MEAGGPNFPEYPGWGPLRLLASPPYPRASDFSPSPPPGAVGLSGAPSVPAPFSALHPGHAPGDPTSAPEFPTRRPASARWGRGHPASGGEGRAGSTGCLGRGEGPREDLRGSGCPGHLAEAGEPGRARRAGGFRALTRLAPSSPQPPGMR